MLCKKCEQMMEIKTFYENKEKVIYNWECPKCGHKKTTIEEK